MFGDLSSSIAGIPPLVTAFLTGLGAVTGMVIGALVNRINMRRRNNYATIASLTQSTAQAEAYSKVMQFLASDPEPQIAVGKVTSSPDLEERVLVMMGMYQFIAFAASHGLIDRRLAHDQFLRSMQMLTSRLRPFIDHYRTRLGREELWSSLLDFVEKHGSRAPKPMLPQPGSQPASVQST